MAVLKFCTVLVITGKQFTELLFPGNTSTTILYNKLTTFPPKGPWSAAGLELTTLHLWDLNFHFV